MTIKRNIINNQSNANYDAGNKIIYNTEVIKSNLCNYNDAYIWVNGNIAVVATPVIQIALKCCAPFTT